MFASLDSSSSTVSPQAPIVVDLNYRTNLVTSSAYAPLLYSRLTVDTLLYGVQEAEILAVVPSPFGGSEMAAFVANLPENPHTFTDYVPLSQTPHCPECGQPLSECDCPPSWLDDPEFEDYRQDKPSRPLQTYTIGNQIYTTPLMIEASYAIPVVEIEQAVKSEQLAGTRIGSRLFIEFDDFEAYRISR